MVQILSIMLSKPTTPFKCLRPMHIRNKYTGQEMTVGCGTCKACLKRMADEAAYKCKLHGLDYKYTMFVTLTYSNDNVPLLRVCNSNCCASVPISYNEVDTDVLQYDAVDVTPRFVEKEDYYGKVICKVYDHPFGISQLHRKFYYFDDSFPYLSKYDAQCFLKRFRKHLSKISDEKITYYLVGEYGPVHFRPHFHVLFFFDSEEIFSSFGKILHKSWTFGNIDYSLSTGKCSNYVAKYVNSRNSCPRIYSNRTLRPFCLHSKNFALRFYQGQKEKVYEDVVNSFNALVRPLDGSLTCTYPWRSLIHLFFPKCKRYCFKSYYELLYSYTVLQKIRLYYKDVTMSSLISHLYCDISNYQLGFRNSLSKGHIRLLEFLKGEIWSPDWHDDTLLHQLSTDETEKAIHRLYSVVHLSVHFLDFVCDGDYNLITQRLISIILYYKCQDYKCLTSSLTLQEELSKDGNINYTEIIRSFYDNLPVLHDDDDDEYHMFVQFYNETYCNLLPSDYGIYIQSSLQDNPLYTEFLNYVNEQFNASIKHKKLNDANDIFCNHNY